MKIKTFTFLLALIFSVFLPAQTIEFTDLANLPAARSALSSANDGENIYVVNGFGANTPFATEIYQYKISANNWSVLTNSAIPKRYVSAAFLNQSLYIFNGALPDGQLNEKVEVIDLSDGAISFTTDHPIPTRSAGVATWNGKLYSFGGFVRTNTYSDKLFEFDPTTTTWTELAAMPFAAETKGEIIDGKLYVFGGFNGAAIRTMAIYDIATNNWETELEMPVAVSAHSVSSIGSKIYLTGDYNNLNSLIAFEPLDQTFQLLTTNLNGRRHCTTEGINDQLFVIGGNTTSSIASSIASVQVAKLDVSTSLKNQELIAEVKLFPNPTTDVLNLDQTFDFVSITNIEGKQIEVYPFPINQITIKHLKQGMYYLLGKKDNKWYRSKWMKM